MKFGNYECFSVDTGGFILDGGAMFGAVPKVLWQREIPADKKNCISLKARSLLIQGEGRNILVDTGLGDKLSEKLKKIYDVDQKSTNIDTSLSKYGLNRNDITDVFITHLHFDHAGGSTFIKNGKAFPAFPNAIYYIQKDEWKEATDPAARNAASYMKENFIPLKESGVLKIVEGQGELFKNIDIIVTNGHTQGQQHLLIKGETRSLFYCADTIPTSAHLSLRWHTAYDNYPVIIIKEKRKLLDRALKENWILFFEHDPDIAAASIKQGEKNVEIDEKIEELDH